MAFPDYIPENFLMENPGYFANKSPFLAPLDDVEEIIIDNTGADRAQVRSFLEARDELFSDMIMAPYEHIEVMFKQEVLES